MKKAVAYYRVSTDRQGQSGLGLEAQQRAIQDFILAHDYLLLAEYTEIESGACNSRPILNEGLSTCKKKHAVLLIARLDRLARSVVFISTLLQSSVRFICVDNPNEDRFITHIKAAVAENEREAISIRTKQALQAAKNRGVELGVHGKYVLSKQNKIDAALFAQKMKPVIDKIKNKGFTSVRKICSELNRLEVPTYRGLGYKWHPQTVHSMMARIEFERMDNKLN